MEKLPWKKHNPDFVKFRQDELNGLFAEGTFTVVKDGEVTDGSRVFGSKFIDKVKRAGDTLQRKSRLVAQNYSDDDVGRIWTKAAAIQTFSEKLLLRMAISLPGAEIF